MQCVATPAKKVSGLPWTVLDEIELCTLSWLGFPVKVMAKRLGRSIDGIANRLGKLNMTKPGPNGWGKLAPKVRRLHALGMTDVRIASRLKLHRTTVRLTRARMGLPTNITPHERAVKASKAAAKVRSQRKAPECWGCGDRCPKRNHIAAAGWVSRPMRDRRNTEVFCRACFEKYGWGDELSKLTEEQPCS